MPVFRFSISPFSIFRLLLKPARKLISSLQVYPASFYPARAMPPPVAQAGRGRLAARGCRGRGGRNGRAETEPSRNIRRKNIRAQARSARSVGPQCDDVGGAEPAQPAARKKRRVEVKRCTNPQYGSAKPAQGSSSSNPGEGVIITGGDLWGLSQTYGLPGTAVHDTHPTSHPSMDAEDADAEHAQLPARKWAVHYQTMKSMMALGGVLCGDEPVLPPPDSEISNTIMQLASGRSSAQGSDGDEAIIIRTRTLSDASSTTSDLLLLDVLPPPQPVPTPRPRTGVHLVPKMGGSVARSSCRPQSARRGDPIPTATRSGGQQRRPRVSPGDSQGGQTGSGRASSPQASDGTHYSATVVDGHTTVTDGKRRRCQEEPHCGSQRRSPSQQRETTNCHPQEDLSRSTWPSSSRHPLAIHNRRRRETFSDSQGQPAAPEPAAPEPAAPAEVRWQDTRLGLRVDETLEWMQLGRMVPGRDKFAEWFFYRSKNAEERVNNRIRAIGVSILTAYPLCDLEENDLNRPTTNNWSASIQLSTGVFQLPREGLIQAQIKSTMKLHAGEVRSWPARARDVWRYLEPYSHCDYNTCGPRCIGKTCGPTVTTVGGDSPSTKIAPTTWDRIFAARWVEADPVFSAQDQLVKEGGCQPNLENAISRLAVWDEDGHRICVREQYGVTLAEVFDRFGDTQTYRTLLDEWSSGMLLIHAKPPRGTSAGKRRHVW